MAPLGYLSSARRLATSSFSNNLIWRPSRTPGSLLRQCGGAPPHRRPFAGKRLRDSRWLFAQGAVHPSAPRQV